MDPEICIFPARTRSGYRRNIDGLDESASGAGGTLFYGSSGSCDLSEYSSLSQVIGKVLLCIL